MRNVILFSILLSVLVGCESKGDADPAVNYNQTEMLTNLGEKVIIPSLRELKNKSEAFKKEVQKFSQSINVNSATQLRQTYNELALSWQSVQFLEFGPAEAEALHGNSNIYPINAADIDLNISSGNYNLEAASNLDSKGLQAMDYLLFGSGISASDMVTYFSDSGEGAKRVKYLTDITANFHKRVIEVETKWSPSGGNYLAEFVGATGNSIGSSIGLMLNALNEKYERVIRDGKIGIPAGIRNISSKKPEPTRVEGFYQKTTSVLLAIETMKAMDLFLEGKGGEGMYDYLDAVGARRQGENLSKSIKDQIDVIVQKMEALQSPLTEEVVQNQQQVVSIFDEMKLLGLMLKVEMTSAVNITITYADNDGD